MSLKYRDSQGNETPIAGLNGTSGELVPSVSLYQTGTITMTEDIAVGDFALYPVTFDTPMPDTDYVVSADFSITGGHRTFGLISCMNKTVNGFSLYVRNTDAVELPITADTIVWQAFKLMTDTAHEADAAAIAQNTLNFAPAFSESTAYSVGQYVTYAGKVYKCTTAHSAGAWNTSHFSVTTMGTELSDLESLTITGVSGGSSAYFRGEAFRRGKQIYINGHYNASPNGAGQYFANVNYLPGRILYGQGTMRKLDSGVSIPVMVTLNTDGHIVQGTTTDAFDILSFSIIALDE